MVQAAAVVAQAITGAARMRSPRLRPLLPEELQRALHARAIARRVDL